MRYLYFHGFASGPQSRKAIAFRNTLADTGNTLEIPDLAQGDFEHLTVSGQLRLIESLIGNTPCRLIGSSMGGYLATLCAARHPETVDRLVLLAPAFGFGDRWNALAGPDTMRKWRQTGWLEVFHYATKAPSRVHYGLLEDARQYPTFPDAQQATLIFHGTRDTVVPVDLSRQFAAHHASAKLRELDSDHELLDVLDLITTEAIPWLITDNR